MAEKWELIWKADRIRTMALHVLVDIKWLLDYLLLLEVALEHDDPVAAERWAKGVQQNSEHIMLVLNRLKPALRELTAMLESWLAGVRKRCEASATSS